MAHGFSRHTAAALVCVAVLCIAQTAFGMHQDAAKTPLNLLVYNLIPCAGLWIGKPIMLILKHSQKQDQIKQISGIWCRTLRLQLLHQWLHLVHNLQHLSLAFQYRLAQICILLLVHLLVAHL